MKIDIDLDCYYINPKYLSVYRVLYGLIVLFFVGLPAYSWLGYSLDYLFAPPAISIAKLFHGFPGPVFFTMLSFINIILFALMILGVWCRWTSLLFSLTCIVGYSFWYSFGKIDHTLLWVITPIFLGFAGWGDYFNIADVFNKKGSNKSIKRVPREVNSLFISLLVLSVAFSMFTSGSAKVLHGWLSPNTEAVRFHLIKNYFTLNRAELMADNFLHLKGHGLWKAFDYSALILEIGFLFSVFRLSLFRYFVASAVIFHILVLLMFNIPFYTNLMVYLLFIDWEAINRKLKFTNLINNPVKYIHSIYIISSLIIVFCGYWFYLALYYKKFYWRLPGILETVLTAIHISNGYKISHYIMFLIAFIIIVALSVSYASRIFKKKVVSVDVEPVNA